MNVNVKKNQIIANLSSQQSIVNIAIQNINSQKAKIAEYEQDLEEISKLVNSLQEEKNAATTLWSKFMDKKIDEGDRLKGKRIDQAEEKRLSVGKDFMMSLSDIDRICGELVPELTKKINDRIDECNQLISSQQYMVRNAENQINSLTRSLNILN